MFFEIKFSIKYEEMTDSLFGIGFFEFFTIMFNFRLKIGIPDRYWCILPVTNFNNRARAGKIHL